MASARTSPQSPAESAWQWSASCVQPLSFSFSLSLISLLLALAVYFGVALAQPALPGMQYDEAADAVIALEMLQGQRPSALKNITLFGRELPLMKQQHIGPTTIYISIVGLALFGASSRLRSAE